MHGQRIDLGGIESRYSLPSDPEEDVVQEEKRNGGGCDLFLVSVTFKSGVSNEGCDEDVAECLACCGVHHEVPAAPALDVGYGDQAEEKIGD